MVKQPYRDLLPPLSEDEFAALKADIKANGMLHPILLDEDGNILDGHHRYKIDKQGPTKTIRGLSEHEKSAFVIGCNFKRRNLSPAQKSALLRSMKATAKQLREVDARKYTQKKLAQMFGVAQQTVAVWFRTNTNDSNGSKPDARVKIEPTKKPEIAAQVASGKTQAQVAANYGVTQKAISKIVKEETAKQEVAKERKSAAAKLKTDNGIIHGDFRKLADKIADGSVSLICTDPPYDKDAVPLYGDLAKFAAAKLKPSGWLVTYSGQQFLPEIYQLITSHLTYAWTFCVVHSGGDQRFRKYSIRNGWKPLIAAYKPPLKKPPEWFRDVISGGKEKSDHPWQQALSEASHFIEALTIKGELVCDPFAGSGTTLLAAKQLGRQWSGCEIDKDYAEQARVKLA